MIILAANALRRARAELRRQRTGRQRASHVFRESDFDFSTIRAGRVAAEVRDAAAEAYVLVGTAEVARVYADTQLGDVFITEKPTATLGVINDTGSRSVSVAGYNGFQTRVRYADGRIATVILISTNPGVTLVEVGGSLGAGGSFAAAGSFGAGQNDLDDFLVTLVTQTEE